MRNDGTHPAVLITMPHSHYSEKARWALDRLSLPYQEQPHIPLLHRLATTRNGGSSVPVLVHGAARLTDSTDILMHADRSCGGDLLYPRDIGQRQEVEALESRFDEDLGIHARRWAYAQLLAERTLLRQVMSRGVPSLEAALLPLILPAIVQVIRKALRITPESSARSLDRVRSLFKEIGDRLEDGRQFLVADRFTAADLTFAALAAPVLFPAGYRAAYPALDDAPTAMRNEVLRLRDTPAGRFALRLYQQERNQTLPTAHSPPVGAGHARDSRAHSALHGLGTSLILTQHVGRITRNGLSAALADNALPGRCRLSRAQKQNPRPAMLTRGLGIGA